MLREKEMTVYIHQVSKYNIMQVLDIISSKYSQQVKIDSYQDVENVYNDDKEAFPNINKTPSFDEYIDNFIKTAFNGFANNYPVIGFILAVGCYVQKYYNFFSIKVESEVAVFAKVTNYVEKFKSSINTHISDEYNGIELVNLINILNANKGYLGGYLFAGKLSEEEILTAFINHEYKESAPELLSKQNTHDVLQITWPYAVLIEEIKLGDDIKSDTSI
jgi:hypothetical protein